MLVKELIALIKGKEDWEILFFQEGEEQDEELTLFKLNLENSAYTQSDKADKQGKVKFYLW